MYRNLEFQLIVTIKLLGLADMLIHRLQQPLDVLVLALIEALQPLW